MTRHCGSDTAVQRSGSGKPPLLAGMILLLMAMAFPWVSALAQTPALDLYDVFDGASIDPTKWTDLEIVREIRGGRLVSILNAAAPTGLVDNHLRFADPASIRSFQADVGLHAYTSPPDGHSRARLMGSYYSASTDPRPPGDATGDVRAQLYIHGQGETVAILYDVYACTNADCSSAVAVVPSTAIQPAAAGEVHTLAIDWDGALFTFTVDGVAQPAVDPGDCTTYPTTCQPVAGALPNVPLKLVGTRLGFTSAGGNGVVAAAFANVFTNGSLYDDFSGPRLDPTRWSDGEAVREVQGGALVSQAVASGAANASVSTPSGFADQSVVTAIQADVTVTDYQAANSLVGAGLVSALFNDGRGAGPNDVCGDVTASLEVGADSQGGGNLRARYRIGYFDADCTTVLSAPGDFLLPITLQEASTLLLSFDGSQVHFSVSNAAGTEGYDVAVAPFGAVVQPSIERLTELRTQVKVNNPTAIADFIAATFDNVYVNGPPAVMALRADKAVPQPVGRSITFTATATGGTGFYESQWLLSDGVTSTLLQEWAAGLRYTWTPATENPDYQIVVQVRSAGGTWVATSQLTLPFPITAPLAVTDLTADKPASQPAGTPITFTATATGGTGFYQSRWFLSDGVRTTLLRNWTAGLSFTWTPATGNPAHRIVVHVRNAGETWVAANQRTLPFPITGPPAVTNLEADKPAPQPAGTPITFTATATGGTGFYESRWFLSYGGAATLLQDWAPGLSYTWTPATGSPAHRIVVHVRNAGETWAAASQRTLPFPTTDPLTGIRVSFRLDPWLISGNYTGGLWVSPPTFGPVTQAASTFALETRAEGLDGKGMPSKIIAQWIPADPGMVTVSPGQGHQIAITVQRPGQSSVHVTSAGVSQKLSITATLEGGALQVEISQIP